MKMEFLWPSSHHSCGQLGPVLVFASKEKEREGGWEGSVARYHGLMYELSKVTYRM